MSFQGVSVLFALWLTLAIAPLAQGWGERGHNLIARVAARILVQKSKDGRMLSPFLAKEHMLGHLANVPDIYFRGLGDISKDEGPTHYIDLEYLSTSPTMLNLPLDFEKATDLAAKNGKDLAKEVGTNPWRCKQLLRLMTEALKEAKGSDSKSPRPSSELEEPVMKALTYAGILAHYLGDLAQPLHSTKDYDGWEAKQGGIHSYFEDSIVSALNLSLDYEVFATALKEDPFKRILLNVPEVMRIKAKRDPVALTMAMAIDSLSHIRQLLRLDRNNSLISQSKTTPIKIPAERKPASAVAENFRTLIVERLALGADMVAYFWQMAWEDAGKPDLSSFRSHRYSLAPDYIQPDYLPLKPTATPPPLPTAP